MVIWWSECFGGGGRFYGGGADGEDGRGEKVEKQQPYPLFIAYKIKAAYDIDTTLPSSKPQAPP